MYETIVVGEPAAGTSERDDRRRSDEIAATLALAGGVAWLLLAGDSIIGGDAQRYRDAAFLVPWTLTALAYWSVHRRQAARSGRLERWALGVLLTSMALMAVGQVHIVVADADENLAFPLAPILFALGSLAFGISTVRARCFSRPVGVMIASSQWLTVAVAGALSPWVPLSDYGNYSGAAMHGIMCLVVAANFRAETLGTTQVVRPTRRRAGRSGRA